MHIGNGHDHRLRAGSRGEFVLTRSVYEAIRDSIGSHPAERGGALGGARAEGVVRHYYHDRGASRGVAAYTPDIESINRLLVDDWNPSGIDLMGFVHSHPVGIDYPSAGDRRYAREILDHNRHMDELLLPIVMTEPDTGRFELVPYVVTRDSSDVQVERRELRIVEDAAMPAVSEPVEMPVTVAFETGSVIEPVGDTFSRVLGAYDLGRLAGSRVIYVGAGGAASFVEDLARAGVAEHVLIDPDVVSASNISTQHVRRTDIGRPKVECLGERITDINPNAIVVSLQQPLDDLSDDEIGELAREPFRRWTVPARGVWGLPDVDTLVEVSVPPASTLICGLTDSFEAQARVNRLALHLGVPSLCAQVYREGMGAEVTFTMPGVTPACHRCALRGRYEAFLDEGYDNVVTSDGTPIVATTRLNALKGFLALAMLQRGGRHPRWAELIDVVGDRNLVQIRMDPALALAVFDRVFENADRERILFDDAVWLPQKPDCPANGYPTCADCGGTGDLRNAIGTFDDTRTMRT